MRATEVKIIRNSLNHMRIEMIFRDEGIKRIMYVNKINIIDSMELEGDYFEEKIEQFI
jgi:hypothetical protein